MRKYLKQMENRRIRLNFCIKISVILMGGIFCHCRKADHVIPFLNYPGFRAQCIFAEDFTGSSSRWKEEGAGITRITADSGLFIQPAIDTVGLMIWLGQD